MQVQSETFKATGTQTTESANKSSKIIIVVTWCTVVGQVNIDNDNITGIETRICSQNLWHIAISVADTRNECIISVTKATRYVQHARLYRADKLSTAESTRLSPVYMVQVLTQKRRSWIHLKLIFQVLPLLSVRYCQFHPPPLPSRAQKPLDGQRPLFFETLRSYSFRHTKLGRTPLDEWSALHKDIYLTLHNTHEKGIHASGEIRTHNPTRRAAADPRFRLRGHCDRQYWRWDFSSCKSRIISSFKTFLA